MVNFKASECQQGSICVTMHIEADGEFIIAGLLEGKTPFLRSNKIMQ